MTLTGKNFVMILHGKANDARHQHITQLMYFNSDWSNISCTFVMHCLQLDLWNTFVTCFKHRGHSWF